MERVIKSMLVNSDHRVLLNGRCSNCSYPIASVEDGEIVIRSRIEKIDPSTGKLRYKCPNPKCKEWLIVENFKIVFNAGLPSDKAS